MTPKVTENKEFAQWFGDWIAGIQQSRVSIERIPPDEAVSAEESKGVLPAQTQVLWSTVEVLPKAV